MLVKDQMEHTVITVRPHTSLIEALRLMREHRISIVLVTDQQEALLGRVTKARSLIVLQQTGDTAPCTAADAMDQAHFTVRPDDPLEKALVRMVENKENSLPVVDSARLVGI